MAADNFNNPTLADLDDSSKHAEPIILGNENAPWLKKALHDMVMIRACEEKIADMATAGTVVCPTHLAIGQEGVAVGVAR